MNDRHAQQIVSEAGLVSNWWLNAPNGTISPAETQEKLTEPALYAHLTDYDRVRRDTPFISTTAGTVERDAARARNVFFPPMYTALRFATRNFIRMATCSTRICTRSGQSPSTSRNSPRKSETSTHTHPFMHGIQKVRSARRYTSQLAGSRRSSRYAYVAVEAALDRGSLPVPDDVIQDQDVYRDPLHTPMCADFLKLHDEREIPNDVPETLGISTGTLSRVARLDPPMG